MNIVKTKLKFTKAANSNQLIAFVSINRKTGFVKGVREDSDLPKMVVFISHNIQNSVKENVLYDVELIPHKQSDGKMAFIAISAVLHQFDASVEIWHIPHILYKVEVKFGNKTILYDPMDGRKESVKTIEGVMKLIAERKDIKKLDHVLDTFYRAAKFVATNMMNDGYIKSKY